MRVFYNEFDGHAAQWLRNLCAGNDIIPGLVDERDIRDVAPIELAGFDECHFFAGVGVWSYALREAGWPTGRKVWTGSCPCQPFSAAGKGNGFADERHLWPAWQGLIEQCRPDTIFGEQVASKDGLAWFDLVLSDLEGAGYAVGVQDTCAAGFGAPHIRQRLFFVADAKRPRDGDARLGEVRSAPAGLQGSNRKREWLRPDAREPSALCSMADTEGQRLLGRPDERDGGRWECASGQGREAGELAFPSVIGREHRDPRCGDEGDSARVGGWPEEASDRRSPLRPGPTNGFWRDVDWLGCTDGKWRPVEPGSFPLAPRAAFDLGSGSAFEGKSRAKMLKGYGNAINAEVAIEFIRAYLDATS